MVARLSVSAIFRWHLLAIATLGLLNAVTLIGDAFGRMGLLGFSNLFRVSYEANIPTLFAALALGAAALVALRLTQADDLAAEERTGWRVFAMVFAFMALDEIAQLHEVLNVVGHHLRAQGPWLYVGIFPYAVVALFLTVILFRFWKRRSRRVRGGIALAGGGYLIAAIGMEMPENLLIDAGVPFFDLRLGLLFAAEELGEMVAVAIFLRTLLVRFEELGGGPLLALVGARPLLAFEIAPRLKATPPAPGRSAAARPAAARRRPPAR